MSVLIGSLQTNQIQQDTGQPLFARSRKPVNLRYNHRFIRCTQEALLWNHVADWCNCKLFTLTIVVSKAIFLNLHNTKGTLLFQHWPK